AAGRTERSPRRGQARFAALRGSLIPAALREHGADVRSDLAAGERLVHRGQEQAAAGEPRPKTHDLRVGGLLPAQLPVVAVEGARVRVLDAVAEFPHL